jgi:uncharacterized protein
MPRSMPRGPSVRVVADTNTVLSAFLWGGRPAEVLAAARERRITLLTSAVLIAELEDVLSRDKFAARIARVGSSVAALLANYRALIIPVRPAPLEPTSRDTDDDHVLACALGADAELIVTRDRDLCWSWARSAMYPSAPRVRRSNSSPKIAAKSLPPICANEPHFDPCGARSRSGLSPQNAIERPLDVHWPVCQ